jgi:hypothetical protein
MDASPSEKVLAVPVELFEDHNAAAPGTIHIHIFFLPGWNLVRKRTGLFLQKQWRE